MRTRIVQRRKRLQNRSVERYQPAEAGLFQTSRGVNKASPELKKLFDLYTSKKRDCMLPVFQGNLTCKIKKSHNAKCPDATSDIVGTGEGADWQRLAKVCPAFAAQYAAIVLRKSGGLKANSTLFGSSRRKFFRNAILCSSVSSGFSRNPAVCSQFQ